MFIYKNALIIGLGISGRSAARFLLKQNLQVTAVDLKADQLKNDKEIENLLKQGLRLFPESDFRDLDPFDLVIISPGISPSHPIYKAAKDSRKKIMGEIELACRFIRQPCFGITGSNGKTSTVLLIEHVLKKSGKKVKAVGNVGFPLCDILLENNEEEILVIELSSWQLETMQTPVLDAAVILNITPNHLDRHITMEAYAKAKFQIQKCLKNEKYLYLNHKTFIEYGNLSAKNNIQTFGYHAKSNAFCDLNSLFINEKKAFSLPESLRNKESHEVENLMAAYLVCSHAGVSSEEFLEAYASYKKPPHRIEFIRKLNHVSYYDDSKATSVDAVLKAVESLNGNIVLIAGGVHKGSSYSPWIQGFKNKVRCICSIGEAAQQMKKELSDHLNVIVCLNLEDALLYAIKKANPGDNILLSPGCSSFDMFKDYKERGELFKKLVNAIK